MNARTLALVLICVAAQAAAQGFAGLGTSAEGFAKVTPGAPVEFPRDRGAHPDFHVEWWYVTANLAASDGRRFGVQWTLFRAALAPGGPGEGWASRQVWMAHAALTSADSHRFAEKFARGGVGQAGVVAAPFDAWIDDWEMAAAAPPSGGLSLAATGDGFGYRLGLTGDMSPVLHGDAGYSVKTASGQASYYYSRPFLRADGVVTIDGEEIRVSGQAWLDREWASQPLDAQRKGWDWMAIYFDTGGQLMVFSVRGKDSPDFRGGTLIAPDGHTVKLESSDIVLTPLRTQAIAGRTVPVLWRLEIPSQGTDVTVTPLNPESWMGTSIPYWEGPVTVTGSHTGRGYLEMTGY